MFKKFRVIHGEKCRSHISFPYQPLASIWVVALSYLLCNWTHPYPVTLLLLAQAIFEPNPFPYEYP